MNLVLNDQSVLDNQEAGTYTAVTSGLSQIYTLTDIVRVPVDIREVNESGGVYTENDRYLSFSAAGVSTYVPKQKDRITLSDGTWVVLFVQDGRFAGYWKCLSRNLTIAAALSETVTVAKEVTAIGKDAQVYPTGWTTLSAGVSASVQPENAEEAEELGKTVVDRKYVVTLPIPVDITAARIRITWGTKYLYVIGTVNENRIDELFAFRCTLSHEQMP